MSLSHKPSAPVIIVCGHFGSGKTNVSVSLALELKKQGKNVTLIDIDTVNPYFRAADAKELMEQNGIKCINPEFANTNVDVPSLTSDIRSVFVSAKVENNVAIFDVGGDNGAAALGQYKKDFEACGYEMLCVVSKYRPLTNSPELTVEGLREIEYYARLRCTHIVNNSNIGEETTLSDVEVSFAYSDEICRISELPLAFTSVMRSDFSDELVEKYPEKNFFVIENTTKKLF